MISATDAFLTRTVGSTDYAIADVSANITQSALVTQLVLQNSFANRTSLMLAQTFSTLAGLLVVIAITWDAWKASKAHYGEKQGRWHFLNKVHPAEVFPLVISSAILMQGLVILGIQGTGFRMLWMGNCRQITEILYPTIWMASYVLLVFATETTIRGFYKVRFGPRGRWNTSICWTAVGVMSTLTWLPTQLRPAPSNQCLANIEFWVAFWGDISLVISSVLLGLYLLNAVLITTQLMRSSKLPREDRIAASRTVYYLGVGIVILVFEIPYWAALTMSNFGAFNTTRLLAGMALTLFGTVIGVMHLMLRGNAEKMAIFPRNSSAKRKRRDWRFFGSTDLNIGQVISTPLESKSNWNQDYHQYERSDAETGSRVSEESRSASNWPSATPSVSRPQTADREANLQRKKSTYSIFPTESIDIDLEPPMPAFDDRRHKRDISSISNATIQIGLRLSHMVPTISHASETRLAPPSLPYAARPRASPLSRRISTTSLEVPLRVASSIDLAKARDPSGGSLTSHIVDRMKTLPPTPNTRSTATVDTAILTTSTSPQSTVQKPSPLRQIGLSPRPTIPSVHSTTTENWPLQRDNSSATSLALLPSTTYRSSQSQPSAAATKPPEGQWI